MQDKTTDAYLKFVFLTGVTKFGQASVFSDLKMEFRSYWFSTGTPTFLIELLKKSDYDLRRLESIEIDESQFTSYRAGNTDPIPVIYQSGYLTIKDYDERFRIYKLGFPNDEVKYGFLNSLIPYYTSLSG